MHNENYHGTKSFFEKYQTFISIIIAAVVIAGGIILSRTLPQNSTTPGQEPSLTQEQVTQSLLKTAGSYGVNKKALQACLDNNEQDQKIRDAMDLAGKSGVQGTPTFFILKKTGSTIKQIPIIGARDETTILKAIETGKAPDGQPDITGDPITLSENDHYLGPRDATITIVEYSDIDCPFCKRAKPVIEKILADHPDYAFVYRHAPLVQLHPYAAYKAAASECVYTLNGEETFWKFLNEIAK